MNVDSNQETIWPAQAVGQLITELRSGDMDSWERLLSRLERRCLALAWRILKDSHLAADAVQDGFMRALQPSVTTVIADTDMEERLRNALASLDEQTRLIFLLVHQEGFSYQEVAREFSWPVGTVRSKLHRARLQLREQLLRRFAC
ncbi:MAG: RNA polymerase sigma factor [Planctomycetota bacterium]